MLLAFIALIALVNGPVQWLGTLGGDHSLNAWLSAVNGHEIKLSLETIFGWVLSPIAWLIGVPWQDATLVGSFIGEKVVINEFVAYADLAKHLDQLLPHSRLIATYALCGFANFSSIAIQIGGIGGLAPNRRGDIARMGMKGMIAGNLAAFMSACWAGILL
jgi:CNT family concentrative nucleoside transporter